MIRKSFATMAALVILGLAALAAHSWLTARNDLLQMRATIAAQQQLITAANIRERDRAATLQQTLSQIAQLKRHTQTPAQILQQLPQYLPLPQPIEIEPLAPAQAVQAPAPPATETPAPPSETQQGIGRARQGTAPSEKSAATPPREPMAQMPLTDLKPLYDFVQDCRSCQAQLAAVQADLRDERTKSAALATQRDVAVKTARGGGFWSGLKRNTKWLAIGAGIGVALTRIAH